MPESQLEAVSSNPDVAEKIFPGIGAIIEKELQLDIQRQGLDVARSKVEADANKERIENVKAYGKMGPLDKAILHRPEAKALKEAAGLNESEGIAIPEIGQTVVHSSGAKITRRK